ncbi:MAG: cobalamin-binding protein [Nitrospiraceae bacterium]
MRICSLLPGATEVVAALGRSDDLVAVSHECDFPPEVRNKPVIVRALIDPERTSSHTIDHQVRGAVQAGQQLYALDEALFARACPDLVITQQLCHVCAVTPDQLQRAISALPISPRVMSLNPSCLDDVLRDIEQIGCAIGSKVEAGRLASVLRARLTSLRKQVARAQSRPKVACIEWLDPLYVAGHWVPEMVTVAGGSDPLGSAGRPSKQVTWAEILASAPDALVLMPCGFSIERTVRELNCLTARQGWASLPAVRNGKVFAVDAASYFSRPGPRLVEGVAMLAALCHPAVFGETLPAGVQRVHLRDHSSHVAPMS